MTIQEAQKLVDSLAPEGISCSIFEVPNSNIVEFRYHNAAGHCVYRETMDGFVLHLSSEQEVSKYFQYEVKKYVTAVPL